jgi:hypothetical protein
MPGSPLDRLVAGRGYEHATSATAFQNAATSYGATSSARYSAASTNATSLPTGNVRFVEVANNDATAVLYVTLGTDVTNATPNAATAGGFYVFPKTSRVFGFQGDGNKVISVLSTVDESAGSINWIP